MIIESLLFRAFALVVWNFILFCDVLFSGAHWCCCAQGCSCRDIRHFCRRMEDEEDLEIIDSSIDHDGTLIAYMVLTASLFGVPLAGCSL